MITSELMQRIKSAGLFPIPVERGNDRDETSDLMFSGTLEDFFEAAKALGATVIFLLVSKLDEVDFHYGSDYDDENGTNDSDEEEVSLEEPAGNSESFDLTVALPSLREFKKYIGQGCQCQLTAKSPLAELGFYLPESWWTSFLELQSKAIEKVDQDREAIREKMEVQRLKKEDGLLANIRSLLEDSDFCRIPTQRGMRAYAHEKFPELKDVDDSRLTQEIQKLSDKAKARKRR